MAGFDPVTQHAGQMTGGIKVEVSEVSFGAGDVSKTLATCLTNVYGSAVGTIGDNTSSPGPIGVTTDVSGGYVTMTRLGSNSAAAGSYNVILFGY